jgi:hypothetical protein
LTSSLVQTFIPGIIRMKAQIMFRILFVLLAVGASQALIMPPASAQQGHDACARDVTRFCRSHMNADDQTVLACLKQHRTRLSKACDKILTDNGQ